MNPFTIVVDSNCDLPAEYISEHDIKVLPMSFQMDGREYPTGDWREISGKEYYNSQRKGSVVGTSQINPDAFIRVLDACAAGGSDTLLLTLSSGLSGTYGNALLAAREISKTYPDRCVFPIDTLNASSGHGLLTMLAVNKRAEGLTAAETAAWLEEKKHSCISLFTVDDLMYLHRGGRLGKISAVAGSVLGFKPILCIAPDGTLKVTDKVRGRKAAFEKLISHLKRSIKPDAVLDTILVNHTDAEDDAQLFASMVKEEVNVRQVIVMMMGPVIGAHLGPGAVTLLFEGDITRAEFEAGS